jgi:hypothetical protein
MGTDLRGLDRLKTDYGIVYMETAELHPYTRIEVHIQLDRLLYILRDCLESQFQAGTYLEQIQIEPIGLCTSCIFFVSCFICFNFYLSLVGLIAF